MLVNIVTISQDELEVDVELSDTINQVKEKLAAQEVKIVSLTGEEIDLNVEADDTITSVKEKLEERQGIPVDQQRLVYQGKRMRDDLTLESYKIYAGCTMHLVVALRGGKRFQRQ